MHLTDWLRGLVALSPSTVNSTRRTRVRPRRRVQNRGLPALENLEPRTLLTFDFGDAPDTTASTGSGNYQTLLANDGPRHVIDDTQTTLFLGARVDGEANAIPNARAIGDDTTSLPDDEGGVFEPAQDLTLTAATTPVVRVRATNTTSSAATLYGWIDYNGDGVFDNATERTSVAVPASTNNGTFTLTFPTVPAGATTGTTYARFRLSSDSAAANSTGSANGGEVEDYTATIHFRSSESVDSTKSVKIASGINGGPTLSNAARFGFSSTAIGDLDGDGVTDLAVGADLDNTGGGISRGAVYIQFMNQNGTAKSSVKIDGTTTNGPVLVDLDHFGTALASVGDLDGDGVNDLVVGAVGDNPGSSYRGAIHVLLMNSNGSVKSTVKIASGTNGGPTLGDDDHFGNSITSLGDLDGDGITDLAVGAYTDNGGGSNRGAVYIVRLNSNGTAKSTARVTSGVNGGPTLGDSSYFGRAVASLGDLDGDGVTDLAVGANRDTTNGVQGGAVHILFLNANGTVKSSTKIANSTNGGPALANFDAFGFSAIALGDLDGDGITDLAVGSAGNDLDGSNRGAVYLLNLNSNGAVKSSTRISSGHNGGPVLANGDSFSFSLSAPGDLNRDGVPDLIVGAIDDDSGGTNYGALHVLFLNQLNEFTPQFASTPNPSVPENSTSVVTTVATDADLPAQSVTYSLTGGADQSKFSITSTGVLTFNVAPNFELPTDTDANNIYLVQVTASDGVGGTTVQNLAVTVTNLNEAPTDLSLISSTIAENNSANATVGTFTATDADTGNTFNYSLVSGAGSADNNNFTITGNTLTLYSVADYESKSSYAIRVRVTDQGSLIFEKQVIVSVTNVNEAPTISVLADKLTTEDSSALTQDFTIQDPESPASNLIVSATSSNTTLFPDGSLILSGTGENRRISFESAPNLSGDATITITVTDGTQTTSRSFQVIVLEDEDPPVISLNSQPLIFSIKGRKAMAIDGTVTITDIDSPVINFNGAILLVSGQGTKDTLSVLKQNNISRRGKNLLLGKTIIGTVSGGTRGAALTIRLNAAATQSTVQSLMRNIAFKAVGKNTGNRTLSFKINNVGITNTQQVSRQIQVVP